MNRLDQAAETVLSVIDLRWGGTGGAPKFPQPCLFQFLWNAYRRTGKTAYRDAVGVTMDNICQGGIYDHLGGGFARYSTDEAWLVPHFEKMLYDNALLVELLTDMWAETGNPLYATRVAETLDWALREMRSTDDQPFAFASALDADSEGEEGKCYLWTEAEIDAVLGSEAEGFKDTYDVTGGGNWEGRVILNRSRELRLGDDDFEAGLRRGREKLLEVRNRRIGPERDHKVLADWNGLMISALAKAGAVFARPEWIADAETVFAFVADGMTADGRLRHSWCAGRLRHPAVLDDYANMCRAALILHGVTGNGDYLAQAERWLDVVDAHYRDSDSGGYFLGADDTDDVIARSKTVHDNAVPSGNGVMAEVLARLYHLTGSSAIRERWDQLLGAIASKDTNQIVSQPTLLNGFELMTTGVQVVIIGASEDPASADLRRAVFDTGLDNKILSSLPPGAALPDGHPAEGKSQIDGRPTAYVCAGPSCSLPLVDAAELREMLRRP